MRSVGIACVVSSLLLAGACGGSGSGARCDTPVATDAVTIKDFAFDPGCVSVSSGASITLTNTGGVAHSFTVKDTGVNVTLDPGDTQTTDLSGIAPGTYEVICTYHPQMLGALKVG